MPATLLDTVLYTAEVVNTPSRVALDLDRARERLTGIAVRPIEREAEAVLEEIRVRDEARRRENLERPGSAPCDRPAVDPVYLLSDLPVLPGTQERSFRSDHSHSRR